MPLRHGLDVSIVSSSFEPFTEYGVNTHARSKLVTAKIEARTGVQFCIAVRPEDPFPTERNRRHGSGILTRAQASDRPHVRVAETAPAPGKNTSDFRMSDPDTNQPVEQQAEEPRGLEAHETTLVVGNIPWNVDEERLGREFEEYGDLTGVRIIRDHRTGRSQDFGYVKFADVLHAAKALVAKDGSDLGGSAINVEIDPLGAPISRGHNLATKPKPPPFDLIAEVFVDGRAIPEIRSIIYLDPNHPHYHKSEVLLKGRRVRSHGRLGRPPKTCIHDWVFTDVGIDILLERMEVEDTSKPNPKDDQDVAELANMLHDVANVDNKEEEEQELKIGKIEVVFTRVVLGSLIPSTTTAISKSLCVQEDVKATPKKSVGRDVTHTTSIIPPNLSTTSAESRPSYEYTRIKWTHYNPAEEFYAKFTFDYTSRAKLVKWGLCDERGVPVEKGMTKHKGYKISTEIREAKGKEKEKRTKGKGQGRNGLGDIMPVTEDMGAKEGRTSVKRALGRTGSGDDGYAPSKRKAVDGRRVGTPLLEDQEREVKGKGKGKKEDKDKASQSEHTAGSVDETGELLPPTEDPSIGTGRVGPIKRASSSTGMIDEELTPSKQAVEPRNEMRLRLRSRK